MREKILLLAALIIVAMDAKAGVEVGKLTVEGRENPMGIDEPHPRFGWQIYGDENDIIQTSYRIIISSEPELAESLKGDVWDSGEISSQCSQWVEPAFPVEPNKEYYWRVKVTTNKGLAPWSQVARWSTGMMAEEWKGCWIGSDSLFAGDSMEKHSRVASRYLRKTFSLKDKVKRATAHICGLGLYKLEINGKKAGNAELAPLGTEYTKTLLYDTYDVLPLLSEDNTILITLGAGNFFAVRQNYQTNVRRTFGLPQVIMNIILEYENGLSDTIATDKSWLFTADGPVRYSNFYDGETYDATKGLYGVFGSDYDTSSWLPVSEMPSPGGKLTGNVSPPITVYATDSPQSVSYCGDKRYILDFGTNGAGRIRLDISRLTESDTIRFRFAEMLDSDGKSLYTNNLRSAQATDFYIGSEKHNGEWTTEFTYHGFRFCEVTGLDSLAASSITRELLADFMPDDGTTLYVEADECPSVLNDILDCARRGIRSNYKGMPLDCPQRDERMPWLGDRVAGCLGESYMMDNRALYAKWMQDICDCQRADGNLSDVSPAYWSLYTNNISWPAALPFGLDMLYRQYGDLRPMRLHYDNVKKFLAYMRRKFWSDGLITKDKYGDWCLPPESLNLIHSKDSTRITPGELISSAYYCYICRIMARYAKIFQEEDSAKFAADVAYFDKEASTTEEAINAKYYSEGNYANGTITANLLAASMGIVREEWRDSVDRSIIDRVRADKYHVSCGVIGIQWLMRHLSDSGNGCLAYKIVSRKSYPSYGYMIDNGATTIWELWNGNTADPSMNSANHVMLLGDLVTWSYEYLGGIRPESPGFSHILLSPDFSIGDVDLVNASHPTPYGIVKSEWRRTSEGVVWDVEVPANTKATVIIPNKEPTEVGSGRHRFSFPN